MQAGEHAFGREQSIGDKAHKERRDHARQRSRSEDRPSLSPREVQSLCQIRVQRDVPCAPNNVVQEHHDAQAYGYRRWHTF